MGERLALRLATWACGAQATLEHPWVGHGFRQVDAAVALHQCGAPLSDMHSDWLFLAYAAGWPVVAVVAVALGWVLLYPKRGIAPMAARVGLAGLMTWSMVKPAFWFPGLALAWAGAVAWCLWTKRG
jgi:hypothetical protein